MSALICPTTGKTIYASEAEALGPSTTRGIYLCAYCEGYHRTRGQNDPQSIRRADELRAQARRREAFSSLPLAAHLDPVVVAQLGRMMEAE